MLISPNYTNVILWWFYSKQSLMWPGSQFSELGPLIPWQFSMHTMTIYANTSQLGKCVYSAYCPALSSLTLIVACRNACHTACLFFCTEEGVWIWQSYFHLMMSLLAFDHFNQEVPFRLWPYQMSHKQLSFLLWCVWMTQVHSSSIIKWHPWYMSHMSFVLTWLMPSFHHTFSSAFSFQLMLRL